MTDWGNIPAINITNTPAGNIAATTVQGAIDELDSEKLGIGAKAADSNLLDGLDSTAFALSGHNHAGVYEPAGAIATHEADTTSVHGIADTAQLATLNTVQTFTAGKTINDATNVPLTVSNLTGTQNIFVAKDNTTEVYTIANGAVAVVQNATGVGIGVTPTSPLHIVRTNTDTSGTVYGVQILPTYNQASGTAANTDIFLNRTQTAVGSGAQRLMDLQVGSTSKHYVTNTGASYFAGNILVGTTTPATNAASLDIVNGSGYGLVMSNNVTDATPKVCSFGVRHYTNAEESVLMIRGNVQASTNELTYGGGTSLWNAVTHHYFYTAANNTTVTGTLRLTIDSAGLFTIWDGGNIAVGTTTGTKFATAANQKQSFWGATPVVQPVHIADPAGGGTVDAEARTAINAINAMLAATGLTAAA